MRRDEERWATSPQRFLEFLSVLDEAPDVERKGETTFSVAQKPECYILILDDFFQTDPATACTHCGGFGTS
jgi:hypothetical protein